MSSRSLSFSPLIALVLLGAKCGGDAGSQTAQVTSTRQSPEAKAGPKVDACSVLTSDEIEAVTGTKSVEPKPEAYGPAATCNYHAPDQLLPAVTIVLAPGMPNVTSSAEMAAWRSKQGTSWGDIKLIIEPVEGLGVPAIRNEIEGAGMVTVEAGVRGLLLDVATSSLEHSKALAAKAMARLP
jgi:hypothetical protein